MYPITKEQEGKSKIDTSKVSGMILEALTQYSPQIQVNILKSVKESLIDSKRKELEEINYRQEGIHKELEILNS